MKPWKTTTLQLEHFDLEKNKWVRACSINLQIEKIYGDCTDLDARQDKLFVLLDRWICHDKISYSKKLLQLLITLVY